jgi:hypothetical protein
MLTNHASGPGSSGRPEGAPDWKFPILLLNFQHPLTIRTMAIFTLVMPGPRRRLEIVMTRDPRCVLSQELEAKQILLDQLRALAADDPDLDQIDQRPATCAFAGHSPRITGGQMYGLFLNTRISIRYGPLGVDDPKKVGPFLTRLMHEPALAEWRAVMA